MPLVGSERPRTMSEGDTWMRLLFITRKWPPAMGGMESYAKNIAEELERICDLTVLALAGRPDGRPPSLPALAFFLLRAVRHLTFHGRRYDAVLLGDLVLFPLALCTKLRKPRARVIQTTHGTDVAFGLRPGWMPALYRLYLRGVGVLRRSVDVVVANSEATARLSRDIGFRCVAVVPLGAHSPEAVPDVRPEEYILFVGRVAPRKGAGWFAQEVMPLLPERFRFKVAGTVWDENERHRVEACVRAELIGPVYGPDLTRLRREALAVVMPNVPIAPRDFVEGFGLAAVEAAAEGAVVLASDLDGIPDAVHDGETGFLLPAADATKWAGKIVEISEWPRSGRAKFIEGSREHVRAFYSWSRTARETLRAASMMGED